MATTEAQGQSPSRGRASLEQRLLEKIRRHERVSKNINQLADEQLTLGQRLADGLADGVGSWSFIITFLVMIVLWVGANGFLLVTRGWDPYPFILLNLVLSFLAGLQAPVIMMSQNRQEAKDRIRAEHDYEVNLKAEVEIEQLQEKLDLLREKQWQELVAMQQRQIALLEQQIKLLEDWRRP
ncbi:MAG: DUF1003 domain-containing protein [Chloroflexi bacterium]|nr:DUF1003 domain-containing protein [Chloroflexota bacterium]MCL5109535.1 DUF1003 domain-containing protein [Chloroflexota bacterium]